MTPPENITLPIQCPSSGHYYDRINELMAKIAEDMEENIRVFSLQIELKGGRKHPTLHDCTIVTSTGPGQMMTSPFCTFSPDAWEAAAALSYRIAGDGGIIGGMVRSGMTRPVYQCMPQGVIVYDRDNLDFPPVAPALEKIKNFAKTIFAYQADTGAHQRLRFATEVTRFMDALIHPPKDIAISYTLKRKLPSIATN